jgi:hypothetical protein
MLRSSVSSTGRKDSLPRTDPKGYHFAHDDRGVWVTDRGAENARALLDEVGGFRVPGSEFRERTTLGTRNPERGTRNPDPWTTSNYVVLYVSPYVQKLDPPSGAPFYRLRSETE